MKISEKSIGKLTSPISDALSNVERHKRTDLFDRYMGEPYGDEVDGKSKYRSTDVADVVDAIFAEAMEIFTGDDNLIEFAPTGPEDEPAARQETDVVNHLFKERHNGFLILSTWFKEGLIEQNAYVRCGWVEKEQVFIDEYEDLSPQQFMLVYNQIAQRGNDYEFERLEGFANSDALLSGEEATPVPLVGDDGQPAPINIRIRSVRVEKVYEIEPIPQDEFFVPAKWRKIGLDGCPVCGHKAKMRRGELRQMGFAAESIERLGENGDSDAEANRRQTEYNDDASELLDAEEVAVCEAYVRADINGDGKDELFKVWTDGDGKQVLKWEDGDLAVEEVEYVPFAAWTPYIVPHRHVGRSVAELAETFQRLKTTLWRHTLDNIYKTNYARPIVNENSASEDTYRDLASPKPGAPIRVESQDAISWAKPPSVLGETMPLLERVDQDLEKRAGATRYAQGLDTNTLAKSQIGSEGVGRIMDAAQRKMALVVRTFAETGLRELFMKIHADLRRGPVRELGLKIRGEWIDTNPMEWRDRTDLSARIGTGRGDNDRRIQALMWMLTQQKEAMAAEAPNVTSVHVFETLKRLARSMGLQSIEPFMADPAQMQAQPATPPDPNQDPALVMAQAEQAKAQADMMTAQTRQYEAQTQVEIKRIELEMKQAELELKQLELGIKQQAEDRQQIAAAAKIEQDDERLDLEIHDRMGPQ